MPKILIFSQDNRLSNALSELLENNSYDVSLFSEDKKAIKSIREIPYDLVFIDFPQNNTINHELLSSIHCFHELLPIIVITDTDKISIAENAIKNGATTYICKPLNPDALLLTLEIALSNANLSVENLLYKRSLEGSGSSNFMSTSSEYMLKVYTLIEKIAKTDSVVLLNGEQGTGKEMIARKIHEKSQRRNYGFCKIDCANLPKKMQESELFGYVKATSSEQAKNTKGVFEKNRAGTVFLDNIDALAMETQIKLLYLLQNKEIQPIGGSKIVDIDIRLIVGSLYDLQEKCLNDEFCKDLNNKLSMFPITLPTLRERRQDIPKLVEHFLSRFASENSKHIDISSQALAVLCEYNWPGNIEQLKVLIKRLVEVNETGTIITGELPQELSEPSDFEPHWNKIIDEKLDDILPLKKYLQTQERFYIQKVLERSNGDKNLSAKKLGISLASFYRKWHESVL